jgi:hypothetical protein
MFNFIRACQAAILTDLLQQLVRAAAFERALERRDGCGCV